MLCFLLSSLVHWKGLQKAPLLPLPGLFSLNGAPPMCSSPSDTHTGELMGLPTLHGILLLFSPHLGGSPAWEVQYLSYCKNELCQGALKSGCVSFPSSVASIPYPVPYGHLEHSVLGLSSTSSFWPLNSEVFRHQPGPCKKALSPFGPGFSQGFVTWAHSLSLLI